MPKVLIADDHAIVRAGIRQILTEEAGVETVGEAGTGPAALEACRAGGWDLLLLDVTLPGRSGVDVLRDLRRECPQLPIIMLSFYLDPDYIQQCLSAGAAGYLAKESLPDDLPQAIRAVLAGKRYVSQAVAQTVQATGTVRREG